MFTAERYTQNAERFAQILSRLERYQGNSKSVSIRNLYGQGSNYDKFSLSPDAMMSMAEPDQFPHGVRILNGIVNPLLYYAMSNAKEVSLTDGSVQDLVQYAQDEIPHRHVLNRLLRSYIGVSQLATSQISDQLIKKTFIELQSSPDIDCRLDRPKKDFYIKLKEILIPNLSNRIGNRTDTRSARNHIYWAQDPTKETKEDELLRYSQSAKLLPHNKYDALWKVDEIVTMKPIDKTANWDRDLYLSLRQVKISDDISVIKFAAGIFPDDRYTEDRLLYPISAIDFQVVSQNAKLARGGKWGSTYDMTIPLKKSCGKVSEEEFPGEATDTSALVYKSTIKTYDQPVALGNEWEKIMDPAIKLEAATRVIWQSIDREIEFDKPQQMITDDTLSRIKKGITNLPMGEITYSFQEMIRKNILIALLASPHRFMEYAGKSGLIKLLFPKHADVSYEQLISQVENIIAGNSDIKEYFSHEEYRKLVRDPTLIRKGFLNGWEIGDKVFKLAEANPDTKSYLERLWNASTLKPTQT